MKLKKDNKGFSLVELIVVVAIMAVLMGILVPTLVKNVEKSKKQKDESGAEEVRSTMEKCLADENFSAIDAVITYTNGQIHVTSGTATPNSPTTAQEVTDFLAEVASQIKDYDCKSKTYKAATFKYIIKDESVEIQSNKGDKFTQISAGGSGNNNPTTTATQNQG